jgi:hypothetical protein
MPKPVKGHGIRRMGQVDSSQEPGRGSPLSGIVWYLAFQVSQHLPCHLIFLSVTLGLLALSVGICVPSP